MNFNNATHITCANGLAMPVNPVPDSGFKTHLYLPVEYQNRRRLEFENWLSQQPELHCSPELSGTYPVDEFGEVVWQYLAYTDNNWHEALPEAYIRLENDYKLFEKCSHGYFETRQFITYIGPKKQERESQIKSVKDCPDWANEQCDCWNTKTCRFNEPTAPEQKGVEQGEIEKAYELFHKVWQLNKDMTYDKQAWSELYISLRKVIDKHPFNN